MSEDSHSRGRWWSICMIIMLIWYDGMIIIRWGRRGVFVVVVVDRFLWDRWNLFYACLLQILSFMFCCLFYVVRKRSCLGLLGFFSRISFNLSICLIWRNFCLWVAWWNWWVVRRWQWGWSCLLLRVIASGWFIWVMDFFYVFFDWKFIYVVFSIVNYNRQFIWVEFYIFLVIF